LRKTLKIGHITWSYVEHGSGNELWLAFHGFGQDAMIMSHFMKTLRPNARVLSFDLPLHGKTTISTEFKMTKDLLMPSDLAELVGRITRESGAKSCSLIGFSLGGKIVLKLVEMIPGKLDCIVLIAPDGLKTNLLYNFTTNTALGKMCFKLLIRFPQPFFVISKLLRISGLLNKKVHQFIIDQMGSKEKREKVFLTWQMFKKIKPELKDVRSKIWRYHIRPILVFGKHDRVIHPKLAKRLSGRNCTTAKVFILEAGHRLLTRENAEFLRVKTYFTKNAREKSA